MESVAGFMSNNMQIMFFVSQFLGRVMKTMLYSGVVLFEFFFFFFG